MVNLIFTESNSLLSKILHFLHIHQYHCYMVFSSPGIDDRVIHISVNKVGEDTLSHFMHHNTIVATYPMGTPDPDALLKAVAAYLRHEYLGVVGHPWLRAARWLMIKIHDPIHDAEDSFSMQSIVHGLQDIHYIDSIGLSDHTSPDDLMRFMQAHR